MGAGSVRARYLVYFQYLGTDFNGVAAVRGAQHAIGVQNYLEEAAERLNSVVPVKFTISSRTDAGVHALSNAAHLDVQRRSGRPPFSPEVLTQALNTHLRHPAIRCLDVAAMREAAQHLLGTHDFRAFQSAGSPATSPVRTLRRASVSPDPASSPFVLPEESRVLPGWGAEGREGCLTCQSSLPRGWIPAVGEKTPLGEKHQASGAENDICAGGRGAGGFDACSGEDDSGEPGPPGQAPEPCGSRPRLVPEGGALRGLRDHGRPHACQPGPATSPRLPRVGCRKWGVADRRKHRKTRHPNSLWLFLLEINTPGAPRPSPGSPGAEIKGEKPPRSVSFFGQKQPLGQGRGGTVVSAQMRVVASCGLHIRGHREDPGCTQSWRRGLSWPGAGPS
ncbi:tRNA pseudouridine synthase-like 1 isoform X2 [Tursiops truncatus]|uniref:tRNA pseudouridine synthase n=1 Tax=Tursiops truncatus TaxID=9739 RepID=A0A6J3QH46_TURTR|nr:tRNA pseudouridine synthase-like 1 isoform X2 [Tursiops truncatus]